MIYLEKHSNSDFYKSIPRAESILKYGDKRIFVTTQGITRGLKNIKKQLGVNSKSDYLVILSHFDDIFIKDKYYKNFLPIKDMSLFVLNNDTARDNFIKRGFNAVCFPLSCFISQSLFYPTASLKEYDLVLNAKVYPYKRLHLAAKTSDKYSVLLITKVQKDKWGDCVKDVKLAHYTRIFQEKLRDLLNTVKVGGIFSEREGSCLASLEYLLCGLPVISTKSIGGRDYFYDEYNSIICDAEEDAVFEACSEMIRRVDAGEIDGKRIKQKACTLMDTKLRELKERVKVLHEHLGMPSH